MARLRRPLGCVDRTQGTLRFVLAGFVIALVTAAVAGAAPPPLRGRIVFVGTRSADGNGDIYVMNADGSGQTLIRDDPGSDNWPVWSPGGKRIAFVMNSVPTAPPMTSDLYVMNADGSDATQLTTGLRAELPAWSPNGSWIAFGCTGDICAIHPNGTGLHRLTHAPGQDATAPAWSPDGRQIAFAAMGGLYVMSANGSGRHRLLSKSGFATWSPNGKQIAFDSVLTSSGNVLTNNLWVMKANGSGQHRLLIGGAAPVWSPDGKWIAFTSPRGHSHYDHIWVIRPDGSDLTPLTSGQPPSNWGDSSPDWTPTP